MHQDVAADFLPSVAEAFGEANVLLKGCAQTVALMTRGENVDVLPTVRCPTSIICGDQDELCPPYLHKLMHQAIPHSTLEILDGCGHIAPLEKPTEVTRQLVACLTNIRH